MVTPGALTCPGCRTSVIKGSIEGNGLRCPVCGELNRLGVFESSPIDTLEEQTAGAKDADVYCRVCKYRLSGLSVDRNACRCSECGTRNLLFYINRLPEGPGRAYPPARRLGENGELLPLRCASCRYSLDGLTIRDGSVTYPECNTQQALDAHVPERDQKKHGSWGPLGIASLTCYLFAMFFFPLVFAGLVLSIAAVVRGERGIALVLMGIPLTIMLAFAWYVGNLTIYHGY